MFIPQSLNLRITGIGIDLVSCERMERFIKEHEESLETFFSNEEIAYCRSHRNETPYFAARFAAKEAVMKAIGIGILEIGSMRDIEIVHEPSGQPRPVLRGGALRRQEQAKIAQVHVSISHCELYSIAQAIAVGE
ncbi:holo-ACP synthase [Paenibacillus sp. MMS18-CY102]|uniref:holo-ACP synthase n=1 Tax=Paenibacillus sp. MMS18-CY102 TaxID=2682849 RepID=UPI001365B437|nr:holo-ACP synthase [Paenibacillus sp. MMS18-CY102]MWC28013.1 holo-[acyl-carrier-protein] synthase [Paenibacillus sp. MMS18-CY102]